MKLCPKCGFLIRRMIVLGPTVKCDVCEHECPSEDLLVVPEGANIVHPEALDELYMFLVRELSPKLGVKLRELGLIPNDASTATRDLLVSVLKRWSRDSFQAVIEEITKG